MAYKQQWNSNKPYGNSFSSSYEDEIRKMEQCEEKLLKFIKNLETKEDETSTEQENLRTWRAERLVLINCRAGKERKRVKSL